MLGPMLSTWETWKKLLAPASGLDQPWLSWSFGEWNSGKKNSRPLIIPLCNFMFQINKINLRKKYRAMALRLVIVVPKLCVIGCWECHCSPAKQLSGHKTQTSTPSSAGSQTEWWSPPPACELSSSAAPLTYSISSTQIKPITKTNITFSRIFFAQSLKWISSLAQSFNKNNKWKDDKRQKVLLL